MKRKIDIQPSEIIVTGANKAGINNSTIASYLVTDNADAIEDLKKLYGQILLSEISISDDGIVFIDNPTFLQFAKNTVMNPVVPVAGWGCANGGCL